MPYETGVQKRDPGGEFKKDGTGPPRTGWRARREEDQELSFGSLQYKELWEKQRWQTTKRQLIP